MSLQAKIFLGLIIIFIGIVSYFTNNFVINRNQITQKLHSYDRLFVTPEDYYNYDWFVWTGDWEPDVPDYYNGVLVPKQKLYFWITGSLAIPSDINGYFDKNQIMSGSNAYLYYTELRNKTMYTCKLLKGDIPLCKKP